MGGPGRPVGGEDGIILELMERPKRRRRPWKIFPPPGD
jgi:hypothetical protein